METRLHARETPGGFEVAGCVYFHGFGAIQPKSKVCKVR